MMTRYRVPYGRDSLDFEMPKGFATTLLESRSLPAISDVDAAIAQALAAPTGGPRLRDLAREGTRVAIVVTDITRACPDHLLVPPLLAELGAAGVRRSDITIVVGIGMHRPSTPADWIEKLGPELASSLRIVNPEPDNPDQLVDLGFTTNGVPASISRYVAEADLVVATGIVEPHQYAGYSGGRKTVAIGAGSEATITYTHGPAMLEHIGVRLDKLDGNPFHEAITEIAERAGLRFVLNVVMNEDKEIVAVGAGAPDPTHRSLVARAREMFTVPIEEQADVAVAGVGYPKDSNLYQASRGASYLYFAPVPVVRRGGVIIIPARAEEGVGSGAGEQRYLEMMRGASTVEEILIDVRTNGYKAGGQRAFVMAQVLAHCEVVIVGSECPELVRDLKMTPAVSMQDALGYAAACVGASARAYVIPHALMTLPVIR